MKLRYLVTQNICVLSCLLNLPVPGREGPVVKYDMWLIIRFHQGKNEYD